MEVQGGVDENVNVDVDRRMRERETSTLLETARRSVAGADAGQDDGGESPNEREKRRR